MENNYRAGIVPYFCEDGETYFHLMVPSNKNYGGTKPQIAKGNVDDGEDIIEAAIREAEEELGYRHSNQSTFEFFEIIEADNGPIHVYIAEIIDPDAFDLPHFETGWAGWLEKSDAIKKAREEHIPTLRKIAEKLSNEN